MKNPGAVYQIYSGKLNGYTTYNAFGVFGKDNRRLMKILLLKLCLFFSVICFCQNREVYDSVLDSVEIREFVIESPEAKNIIDSVLQNKILGERSFDEMYLLSISNASKWTQLVVDTVDSKGYLRITKLKRTSDLLFANSMIGFCRSNGEVIFIIVKICDQDILKPTGEYERFGLINLVRLADIIGKQEVLMDYFGVISGIEFKWVENYFRWVGTIGS